MTYQCQRGPPNNNYLNGSSPVVPQNNQNTKDQKQRQEQQQQMPYYDNYLQLRKDAMRIPMQFFFKSRVLPDENAGGNRLASAGDDYFSFNGVMTEEAKDEHGNPRSRNGRVSGANSS